MSGFPEAALSHVGFYVTDLAKMRAFYVDVLGFTVTDEGELNGTGLVFLSRDPRDHHQIVIAAGRPPGSFTQVNQVSLRVDSLDALRRAERAVRAGGATDIAPIDHGNAWSVYFRDPEGNRIEVFMDTPWYIAQPHREPLDLSLPDDALTRACEARVRSDPSYKPAEQWRAEIAARIKAR